jgi:hypothetical protein
MVNIPGRPPGGGRPGQTEEVYAMSTNLPVAPPSKTVDGSLSVPIDIEVIQAVLTFYGATQSAVAGTTIT